MYKNGVRIRFHSIQGAKRYMNINIEICGAYWHCENRCIKLPIGLFILFRKLAHLGFKLMYASFHTEVCSATKQ